MGRRRAAACAYFCVCVRPARLLGDLCPWMWKTQVWTGLGCSCLCVHLCVSLGGGRDEAQLAGLHAAPHAAFVHPHPHTPGTHTLAAHMDRCCGSTYGPARPRVFTHFCGPSQSRGIHIDVKTLAGAQHPVTCVHTWTFWERWLSQPHCLPVSEQGLREGSVNTAADRPPPVGPLTCTQDSAGVRDVQAPIRGLWGLIHGGCCEDQVS